MRKPRVVIWGWHHDSNKGDGAILRGIVDRIGKAVGPVRLDVFLGVRRPNPAFMSAVRFEIAGADSVERHASLLCIDRDDSGLSRLVRGVCALVQLVALYVVSPFRVARRFSAGVACLQDADAVVGKGGHYIYARSGVSGTLGLLLSLAPLLIAQRLRRPTYLLGVSLGPFPSMASRTIAGWALGKCDGISVRDGDSLDQLHRLGVSGSRMLLATDYAFALHHSDVSMGTPDTIFVNVRGADPSQGGAAERWVAQVATVIRLVRKKVPEIAVVPLITAAGVETEWVADRASEDDRASTARLLVASESVGVPLEGWESKDTHAILAAIRQTRGGFAVRLHAGILSLVAGRPCVLVDYFGTKAQVFRTLGLGDWLTSFDRLGDASEGERVAELLRAFVQRPEESSRCVEAALAKARELLEADSAFLHLAARLKRAAGEA